MFQQLGNTYDSEEDLQQILEEYTCAFYGKNQKDVNLARYEIFKDVCERKNKIQDLFLLPPCKQTLLNHCKRANFVAARWKSCLDPDAEYHDITRYGWTKEGNIIWFKSAYPKTLESFIFNARSEHDDNGEFQLIEDDDGLDKRGLRIEDCYNNDKYSL